MARHYFGLKMKTYKDLLAKLNMKKERKQHLAWHHGDIEIKDAPDRSGHLAWKEGDVKFDKKTPVVKESLNEELADTHDKALDLGPSVKEPHVLHPENRDHFNDHHKNLSQGHRNSIAEYKSTSYLINKYHRKKGELSEPEAKQAIKHSKRLDKVTNVKTKKEMHGYRAFGGALNVDDLKKGATFKDNGYTGLSLHHSIAQNFSKEHVHEDETGHHYHNYVARVHVPKGTKAHYLDNDHARHDHKSEKEVLLHRGTTFKVVGHSGHSEQIGNHWSTSKPVYRHNHIVHLEVHDQEDHPGE
jgi:hypothetical protein